MQAREPVVAGAFYPYGSEELKKMVKGFLDRARVEKRNVIGIVSPHAGYVYCGKTAASVYKSVGNKFDAVVIMGPNHSGTGDNVATSLASWKTPLGIVNADEYFVKELTKDSIITIDEKAHSREHSIEVQLPWLQYLFKAFRIVPISINPTFFDAESCSEIGNRIADAAKKFKRKVLIVASSDFTHYGYSYGYLPFKGGNVIEKIKELDMSVIKLIEKLDAKKLVKISYEKGLTICGYGAIASMLFAAKKLGADKGELLDYSTSFDVSRSLDAVVGYAGIAIY
jgi:AmmeMemoRadiSam system protein B